ncbi:ArpA protein [Streptomyces sp. MRC013]|uniref:HalD/BesD family halogenase n=1 Tax=Streptomyces sp. MRC013 TaxID=2898276 RepID=UPI0020260561|nr:ArpA protein [Streptomyces sp. MRC013]URM88719.1 ArpA protein [Streptomyces sp. MRC013]
MDVNKIDETIGEFLAENYSPERVEQLADRFSRKGVVKFDADARIVPEQIVAAVQAEADRLIEAHKERRSLVLGTTGNSPRKMSVVRSEEIEKSELIRTIATSRPLLDFLGRIAREPVVPQVSGDERYLITHQEFKADTHGWHWDDYSFGLIWALRMPPVSCGGMVQTVPHTHWDKANPRINEILCERQIDTHGLRTGDLYLQRTDTTMHRTVPLTEDGAARTILNMTWAGERDLGKPLVGDDRWWEDPAAQAAQSIA